MSQTLAEIKKLNKIVTNHRLEYSIGLETDQDNPYPTTSPRYVAFNHGRLVRTTNKNKKHR